VTTRAVRLDEAVVEHRRLGRHVAHDDRSWGFQAAKATKLKTVKHATTGLPLNQGDLGSCTGNAMTGLLMTAPFDEPSRVLTETDAVELYERATQIDHAPGQYPPDDTGSSGLYVAKAAREKGWIKSYHWAFGLQHALAAVVVAPVIIGIEWWSSFDEPDEHGVITITDDATVRGGHEVLVYGIDVDAEQVFIMNSWGAGWGVGGACVLGWRDFGRLLADGGDVVTVTA
jgi:hypothetical protein